jgi:hypothetical protein
MKSIVYYKKDSNVQDTNEANQSQENSNNTNELLNEITFLKSKYENVKC